MPTEFPASSSSAQASANDKHDSQESLRDLCKLIISLSSGVLAISATFASKMVENAGLAVLMLMVSWLYLVFSIISGVKAIDVLADAQQKGTVSWWSLTIGHARKCWKRFKFGVIILIVFCATTSLCTALSSESMSNVAIFWIKLYHSFGRK